MWIRFLALLMGVIESAMSASSEESSGVRDVVARLFGGSLQYTTKVCFFGIVLL
jgi:hypothetical protein